MRNELIKITTKENGQNLVSARELYDFLEVKVHFSTWVKRMCEYGFEENIDFSILKSGNPNGGISKIDDYVITTDMAKEISMIQRTDKGKQARQYFIECEKQLKEVNKPSLPATYLDALKALVASEEEKAKLKEEKLLNAPKVNYYEAILTSKDCVTTTQIAKDYGLSARELNIILNENKVQFKQNSQWLLYSKYQNDGLLKSETYRFTHKDGSIGSKISSKWTQKGRLFIHELLKDLDIKPIGEKSYE